MARTLATGLVLVLLAGCSQGGAMMAPPVPADGQRQVAAVQAATAQLRTGDLVFRRGRDVVSAMVLSQQAGSRFSHVGVVVVDADRLDVVHAMPEEPGSPGGVRREPLAAFLHPDMATDAASYRLPGLDADAVLAQLLPRIGAPFDMAFELSTPQRVYCTELALDALTAGGAQLAPVSVRAPLLREPVVTPEGLRQVPGLVALAGD